MKVTLLDLLPNATQVFVIGGQPEPDLPHVPNFHPDPWEAYDEDGNVRACPVCLRYIKMRWPSPYGHERHDWDELVLSRHNKAKGVVCEGSGLSYGNLPRAEGK